MTILQKIVQKRNKNLRRVLSERRCLLREKRECRWKHLWVLYHMLLWALYDCRSECTCLQDRGDTLEPHAGVDMLVGEFLKAAVALAVVLDEHHVPDLAPAKEETDGPAAGDVERDNPLGVTTKIAPTASTRTHTRASLRYIDGCSAFRSVPP